MRAQLPIFLLLLLAAGCSTYSDRNLLAREDLRSGDLAGAEARLNDLLQVETSRELPRSWGSETALLLLERATVLQAMGDYRTSARDFTAAEKELELLDIANDTAGDIGKYVFSDDSTKYKAPPTEKLLVNALNMINYLALGDLSGARVEARRFQVMRRYLTDYFPDEPHGAFGSYLAGLVFELSGEPEIALRHYDEVLAQSDAPSLHDPIRRLAARAAYRSPRIDAVLEAPTPASYVGDEEGEEGEGDGEILVILKTGTVPVKQAQRIPVGAALGLASNYVSGDTKVLEYGLFKVVSYPELIAQPHLYTHGSLRLGDRLISLETTSDVSGEIMAEYEEVKPKILGAALTRMIVRAAGAEAARAAGNQQSGALGFLAAAIVEGSLVAMDKPDTRSWSTLPAAIHLARISVPAGTHDLALELRGRVTPTTVRRSVHVEPGGFAIVDVTTLR